MDNYSTIFLNDKEYYLSEDIYKFDSSYFYGTGNNIRNIVNKKRISQDDHIYAYIKDKEWTISNKKYCRSKLLLTKEWCMDNIPKFAKHNKVEAEIEKLPPLLELDNEEKFCDNEFIYNIKIRGERKLINATLVPKMLDYY